MNEIQHVSIDPSEETHQEHPLKSVGKQFPKRAFIFGLAGGVIVLAILVGVWFGKGLVIAAVVNGTPITRIAVIQELEKQSGRTALESIIKKKLIDDEARNKNISVSTEDIDKEIKQIEAQVTLQGGTLDAVLQQQGMTEKQLREQIEVQKKIEKLLGDKVSVSDTEVEAYIAENKIELPQDKQPEDAKASLKEQLKQQKLQQEAQKWVSDLTASAKIKYYVNY